MTMQISVPTASWTRWRGSLDHGRNWLALISLWRRRAQERQALRAMSLRDLRDIRLTRAEAQREIQKPFWRA